jgi:hypothetical protein
MTSLPALPALPVDVVNVSGVLVAFVGNAEAQPRRCQQKARYRTSKTN